MTAWSRGTKLGEAEFAERFFGRAADDPVAGKLHDAALGIALATNHAELREAAENVGDAMQTIGLDRWPRFLADAHDRALDPATVAAVEKSQQPSDPRKDAIRPVYPIETALGVGAAGIAGGVAAAVRAAGGAILRQVLPEKPTPPPASGRAIAPPSTTSEILSPNGKPVGIVHPNATPEVRTVSPSEFQAIEGRMLQGATPASKPGYPGTWYQRPDGSFFGIRNSPQSGRTIDVSDPNLPSGFKVHQQ